MAVWSEVGGKMKMAKQRNPAEIWTAVWDKCLWGEDLFISETSTPNIKPKLHSNYRETALLMSWSKLMLYLHTLYINSHTHTITGWAVAMFRCTKLIQTYQPRLEAKICCSSQWTCLLVDCSTEVCFFLFFFYWIHSILKRLFFVLHSIPFLWEVDLPTVAFIVVSIASPWKCLNQYRTDPLSRSCTWSTNTFMVSFELKCDSELVSRGKNEQFTAIMTLNGEILCRSGVPLLPPR